jgi:hypothetical protein
MRSPESASPGIAEGRTRPILGSRPAHPPHLEWTTHTPMSLLMIREARGAEPIGGIKDSPEETVETRAGGLGTKWPRLGQESLLGPSAGSSLCGIRLPSHAWMYQIRLSFAKTTAGRATGTDRGRGAKIPRSAPSRAIDGRCHRHRPGRIGLRLHDADQPFPSGKSRKVQDFVRQRKWRINPFWQR